MELQLGLPLFYFLLLGFAPAQWLGFPGFSLRLDFP